MDDHGKLDRRAMVAYKYDSSDVKGFTNDDEQSCPSIMLMCQPSSLASFLVLSLIIPLYLTLRLWRLRKVPGPLLCHVTNVVRTYHQNHGRLLPWLTRIHEKYGTVVCIGPNTISVSDATKVPSIYTMHGEFQKVCG
jgi:hypothetical protein